MVSITSTLGAFNYLGRGGMLGATTMGSAGGFLQEQAEIFKANGLIDEQTYLSWVRLGAQMTMSAMNREKRLVSDSVYNNQANMESIKAANCLA